MAAAQNIIGSTVQAIRRRKGLTQALLAGRCGMLGWDVGENVITKIETHFRCVTDVELLCLAKALEVHPEELLPGTEKAKAVIKAHYRQRPSSLD